MALNAPLFSGTHDIVKMQFQCKTIQLQIFSLLFIVTHLQFDLKSIVHWLQSTNRKTKCSFWSKAVLTISSNQCLSLAPFQLILPCVSRKEELLVSDIRFKKRGCLCWKLPLCKTRTVKVLFFETNNIPFRYNLNHILRELMVQHTSKCFYTACSAAQEILVI